MVIPGAGIFAPDAPVGDCVPRSDAEDWIVNGRISIEAHEAESRDVDKCEIEAHACLKAPASCSGRVPLVPQPGTFAALGEKGSVVGACE